MNTSVHSMEDKQIVSLVWSEYWVWWAEAGLGPVMDAALLGIWSTGYYVIKGELKVKPITPLPLWLVHTAGCRILVRKTFVSCDSVTHWKEKKIKYHIISYHIILHAPPLTWQSPETISWQPFHNHNIIWPSADHYMSLTGHPVSDVSQEDMNDECRAYVAFICL